ncbi:MAG: PD-(D/E)XK nuclease family protein [Planctomycetota bacterium]
MNRVWLNWEEPLLSAAAAWLLTRSRRDGAVCDLRHVAGVTPGARSGRMLLAELIRRCDDDGLVLTPPRLLTPGALTAALLETDGARASRVECAHAWMRALRAHPRADLAALLPEPPAGEDDLAWLQLARRLDRLHRELAGELVSFDEMARHAEELTMFSEAERWRTLSSLRARYEDALRDAGRIDPDQAAAEALDRHAFDDEVEVVLIGVGDLGAQHRAIVTALGDRATALVPGTEAIADRFDDLGCVCPAAWREAEISLRDEQVVVADQPADQAQAALEELAGLDDPPAPSDVCIGLGDDALTAPFQSAGQWAGVRFHHVSGRPLAGAAPVRLLAAVADWLEDPSIACLAGMLRHADFEAWLQARAPGIAARALGDLDQYEAAHPGGGVASAWHDDPEPEGAQRLRALTEIVDRLCAKMTEARRPLSAWARPILDLVGVVYRPQADDAPVAACGAVRALLSEYHAVAADLDPPTDGVTALRLVVADAEHATVAADPGDDEIDLLGWSELALDPAPIMIVAGVNDGNVPGSVTADAFLPDGLRVKAGLMSNERRYARDAHIMETLCHGREHVRFVAGRRDADGEPLTPSRLLLACPRESLPGRVLELSDEKRARRFATRVGSPAPADTSGFTVPDAPGGVELERMAVTSFRDYLQCPYRFWLRRVRRLRAVADGPEELDALLYGILAHGVLQDFGEDTDIRDSADPARITAFLNGALDRRMLARCGADPPPAVSIQAARLRLRLEAFAQRQAAHRAEGWEVREAEYMLPGSARLELGNGEAPIRITGKIDRIDHRDGEWLIIDYKTGDNAAKPDEAHRAKDGTWTDLQLPLYGHLAPEHGFAGPTTLAYFSLPREPANTALHDASWTDEEREEAVEIARRVVRDIRAGNFDMTSDYPGNYHDDFQYICQTTVFGAGEGDE